MRFEANADADQLGTKTMGHGRRFARKEKPNSFALQAGRPPGDEPGRSVATKVGER